MKLLVNINVKSISKAITNSSSEVFLVKSKRPAEEIKKIISSYADMAWKNKEITFDKLSKRSREIVEEDKLELYNDEVEKGSGMGGDICVYSIEDAKRSYGESFINEKIKEYGLTEDVLAHYVVVDIDHNRNKTIEFLYDNFDTKNTEGFNDTDEEEKRLYNIYDILSYGSPWM